MAISLKTSWTASRRGAFWYCLLAALLGAAPVGAQTRLEWPDSSAHIERYATVEQCLSATQRARDSLDRHSLVWRDTLALTLEEARAPLPPIVRETAHRCGARYLAATAPLADFAPVLQLYLLSDDDASAAELVERRLRRIPDMADRERAAVLDTVAKAYLGAPYDQINSLSAQPVRLAEGERRLNELGKLPRAASSWTTRMHAYGLLMEAAWNVGDSARVRRGAEGVLAIGSTLTAADRRSTDFISAQWRIYRALNRLNEAALLDSLRHGTAGYVAL
jgi:hypothetical protein